MCLRHHLVLVTYHLYLVGSQDEMDATLNLSVSATFIKNENE